MHRIFTLLKAWLTALTAAPCPPDPLAEMSLSDLADLPITHPAEPCGC